jgi:uncharacterized Zn-binding protein involved in type VI secretion
MATRKVGRFGDTSTHGGTITNANQDGTVKAENKLIAVDGAILSCPIHGAQIVNSNLAVKSKVNNKNMVLDGSIATCGAVILASATKTFVE